MTVRTHSRASQQTGDGEAGYILVFVLIGVALIALLATLMVRTSHQTAREAIVETGLISAELAADGVVHTLMRDILAGEVSSPLTGAIPPRMIPDGFRGAFRVLPSTALLDINKSGDPILTALLHQAGAADVPALVDAIKDWRDPDNDPLPKGAERAYYAAARQPGPANRPFVDVRELLLVKGMTQSVFNAVKDHVTIFGGERLFVSAASDTLKQVAAALGPTEANNAVSESYTPLAAPLEMTVTVETPAGVRFTRHFVVRLLPDQRPPYLILHKRAQQQGLLDG